MTRAISFALTERAFLDGDKTVTRRVGWRDLKAGDELAVVRKAMGLRKGEKRVLLGHIRVTTVRRERLDAIDAADCAREGFPEMTPAQFVEFFRKAARCPPDEWVTRIAFERIT